MRISYNLYKEDLPNEHGLIGDLAIDCESMGLVIGRDRLCLVQICDDKGKVALVQFSGKDYSAPNLRLLLQDETRQKIFHYGRFDIAIMRYHLKLDAIKNIFCTKIASKLARTYTDAHGLKSNVRELLGIELDKESQSTNWGREQLTDKQLQYASSDVFYLHRLRNELISMLQKRGHLKIAHECFAFLDHLCTLDLSDFDEQVFNH
jgi:ribonuclease D